VATGEEALGPLHARHGVIFNSVDFFVFFLLLYPLVLVVRARARNLVLLAASYYFYAQWNVKYLSLIVVITVIDFVAALIIERFPQRKRILLVISICTNLGILGTFKYYNFLARSLAQLVRLAIGSTLEIPLLDVLLPVGVSFYTFESLSYVIDVYRGKLTAHRSILEYSLFISFFPHLVAGPIIRPNVFLGQLAEWKRPSAAVAHRAILLFFTGLFKKKALADNLAGFADPAFSAPWAFGGLDDLFAVYAFAFQIYYDFSGYTDMAIAIALLLGFELPENFRHPYAAASFREFWQRWHISLSSWLRDYLYVSLGGNRKGPVREYANLLITMLLGGLWHGANVTFVVWGALHGLYLIVERLTAGRLKARGAVFLRPLRAFAVFQLVCLAWVFFRAPDLTAALVMLGRIFRGGSVVGTAVLGRLFALLGGLWLVEVWLGSREPKPSLGERRIGLSFAYLAVVIIGIVVFGESRGHTFIYFQF
jgi:alginate O-acetyltransferase complex protein AlgI